MNSYTSVKLQIGQHSALTQLDNSRTSGESCQTCAALRNTNEWAEQHALHQIGGRKAGLCQSDHEHDASQPQRILRADFSAECGKCPVSWGNLSLIDFTLKLSPVVITSQC